MAWKSVAASRKKDWDKMIWLSPLGENGFLWAIKIDLFVLSAGNISYISVCPPKSPKMDLTKRETLFFAHGINYFKERLKFAIS